MAELAVITPSRDRPVQFAEMAATVQATAGGDVAVHGYIDHDDPEFDAYWSQASASVYITAGPRRTLSGWTNLGAQTVLAAPDAPRYLASFGDDHRPRTKNWDRVLIDAVEQMDGPGIAYGNDLFQGERLPTAWVVSADLVRAVGWMMLPACEHLFVDAAVLELGRAAGRIAYRPEVVIEHLHPVAGKAAWDESYRASNAGRRYEADGRAFVAWRDGGGLVADAEKVKQLQH